jgi:hypothetical protein
VQAPIVIQDAMKHTFQAGLTRRASRHSQLLVRYTLGQAAVSTHSNRAAVCKHTHLKLVHAE